MRECGSDLYGRVPGKVKMSYHTGPPNSRLLRSCRRRRCSSNSLRKAFWSGRKAIRRTGLGEEVLLVAAEWAQVLRRRGKDVDAPAKRRPNNSSPAVRRCPVVAKAYRPGEERVAGKRCEGRQPPGLPPCCCAAQRYSPSRQHTARERSPCWGQRPACQTPRTGTHALLCEPSATVTSCRGRRTAWGPTWAGRETCGVAGCPGLLPCQCQASVWRTSSDATQPASSRKLWSVGTGAVAGGRRAGPVVDRSSSPVLPA